MINFEVLKLELLGITELIESYTSDPGVIVAVRKLKTGLKECSLSFDMYNYCLRTISSWYSKNIHGIVSNTFTYFPQTHKESQEKIEKLIEDIEINEEKYKELFKNSTIKKSNLTVNKSDIFVVHGREDGIKNDVARFLERLNFKPIILHEQASKGDTIIEKIEEYTNVGFGVILYTACDLGGIKKEPFEPMARARQNVIFEHGYLIGKLGRDRVAALVKGDLEKPNDISGVVYINYTDGDDWKIAIVKELKAAGYSVDLNKIL